MKRINKYIFLLMLITGFTAPVFSEPEIVLENNIEQTHTLAETTYSNAVPVLPSAVAANPEAYLNKFVTMNARFDKFSTIGLDYPPALRKTEDYISFLVYRDDTVHDIPLSEMKLFMKRDEAQKFIDLKSKDNVNIVGRVFSAALGDPWVDVYALKIVK